MIIRFENLDNPAYSAQFTFNNSGFVCAEYDYADFFDFVDPDLSTQNYFTEFLDKIEFDIFTDDFVGAFSGNQYHIGKNWHSYKINFTSGDYRKFYFEGFNSWVQNDFDSVNACSCTASINPLYDLNNCPNNLYDDFVSDSWTSSKCLKITKYYEPLDNLSFNYYNYLDNDDSAPCFYKGFLPTISFKEPNLNYPLFKIYAYDFNNFSNDDCKYSLFLHVFYLDSGNNKKIKTHKVGSFGVFQGNFYFENFYGNKVSTFTKRFFDFYTFFNTNTIDNVSDYMNDNFNNFSPVNINSFGESFVFELKKEDYSGVYMSTLDCECLTTAINSLNTTLESLLKNSSDDNIVDVLDDFHKSFTHAFNKTLITEDYSFGSGSVFKSNDLDNYDFYNLIDNKGKTCLSPIFIDKCDSDDLGSTPQKPLYITNTDTKGSSCQNPLYLNLCDMPAIKINDLFNRISVGGIDINSLPLDYTSLISTLLGSIITALGNLLKPSDTLTIALPNIQISNMPNVNIASMPNINISNSSSSPVNIALTNGGSCNDPLHIDLCPFTFSEIPVRINSIPPLDVDIDTMPINRTVTHLNNAVDISCICDELDDIDKGLVAEFASLDTSLGILNTSLNNFGRKFDTSCDTSIGQAFGEAFNLTNCLGSVFKANDNNWSGEDTLAGFLYKNIDYSFVNNNDYISPFYTRYSVGGGRYMHWALPDLFVNSLYRTGSLGNILGGQFSVFNVFGTGSVSFTDCLNRAFFSDSNNNSLPSKSFSVFNFGYGTDNNKILNHNCSVNACSIKFCDNSLPVDIVNPSNNPVKVEMEPTSSTINVNVESAPADGDSIFINADGKTFLNNNNFK